MVITFPNLGNVCFAVKVMFETMKIPFVIPESNNKATLEIGSFYSPEEICLPFKIMMGNYIQSIKKGADTILITGSCGPCRFGEYCELQMKILKRLNYDLNFIVVDSPFAIGMEEFKRRIGEISGASSVSKVEQINGLNLAYKVVDLLDKIEAKAHELAGYEINKGECKHLLNQCKAEALACPEPRQTVKLLESYQKKIEKVRIDPSKDPIKIAIIGEIYTVIEPFSNLYIEEKLMDYGVSSKRMLTPSWWVRDTALKPVKLNSFHVHQAAKEYLPYNIGGHGKECVGEALLSKKANMDGAIQIFPLGCMPEVVAKAILPSIQRDKDFPVMTLVMDEIAGEAGYITRIEAFLDMLAMRKKAKAV